MLEFRGVCLLVCPFVGARDQGVENEEISIPPKLRESLTKLIEKHSNGLWLSDLLIEYRVNIQTNSTEH
jgi:hypothetical protein